MTVLPLCSMDLLNLTQMLGSNYKALFVHTRQRDARNLMYLSSNSFGSVKVSRNENRTHEDVECMWVRGSEGK